MKIFDKEYFIERANKIHGNKYDYSKVEYINAKTKVCVICPIHGEFSITPNSHINGSGCSKCSNNKRLTTEEFVDNAKLIHGNKYNYSKVEYVNNQTKVCVICPIHGEFSITPANHLRDRGCPYCNTRKELLNIYISEHKTVNIKQTIEEFIEKAKQIHGDKYDYSKVNYVNNKTKVCIICPEHGEFHQTPNNHLNSQGCPKCGVHKRFIDRVKTKEQFTEDAIKIHGNKYNYSKVEYANSNTKICISCYKHGEFWQTPVSHLNGNGCSKCTESKLENEVRVLLEKNNISYISQKHFDWLKYVGKLSLDFYLPDYNIAIECQGEQHFKSVDYFGGKTTLIMQQKRDEIKRDLCTHNNIPIIYYGMVKRINIITNLEVLLKKIKNYGKNY